MTGRLDGRRVLVTQASDYMGPAIAELFRTEGADVVADERLPRDAAAIEAILGEAGQVEILIANLAEPPRPAVVAEIDDADWSALFDAMVTPLMRLVRGVVPQMIERGSGKIVAVTSAAPLRGIPKASAYCAARGAQNAFVRAAGVELASKNVQINAIAQNYIQNDTYYPPDLVASDRFREHLARNVPARTIGEASATAELALFLSTPASDFVVGQVVPLAGGWA